MGHRAHSAATSPLAEAGLRTRGLGVLGAVAAHGLVFAAMRVVPTEPRVAHTPARPVAALFDIDLSPPPVRAPEPAAVEPPPAPKALRTPPSPRVDAPTPARIPAAEPPPAAPPEAPAAAAAAAAEAVTSAPDSPSASANTIASGTAAAYAGGATAGAGTATQAVRSDTARADGVVGGTGTGAADRSRPAALLGGFTWNDCPLPVEAEDEGVEHATVQLRLKLSADGRVDGIEVVADPGYGFAREALRCARQKRFSPALDREGRPVSANQLVIVRF